MADSHLRICESGDRGSPDGDPLMELARIVAFHDSGDDHLTIRNGNDVTRDRKQELNGNSDTKIRPIQPLPAYAIPSPSYRVRDEEQHSSLENDEGPFDLIASLEGELNQKFVKAPTNIPPFTQDQVSTRSAYDTHSLKDFDSTIYEPAYEAPFNSWDKISFIAEQHTTSTQDRVCALSFEDELKNWLVSEETPLINESTSAEPIFRPESIETIYPDFPRQDTYKTVSFPNQAQAKATAHNIEELNQKETSAYFDQAGKTTNLSNPHDIDRGAFSVETARIDTNWTDEELQLDDDFFHLDDELQRAMYHAVDPELSRHSAISSTYSGYKSFRNSLAPEVETVPVKDNKVEQTYAFDFPKVDYDDYELAANKRLDDLESEFAEIFSSIEMDEQISIPEVRSTKSPSFEDHFSIDDAYPKKAPQGQEFSYINYETATTDALMYGHTVSPDSDYDYWISADHADNNFDYERSIKDELDIPNSAEEHVPTRKRIGIYYLITATGIIVLGGLGYYVFSIDNSKETPVVIHADNQPVKIQPENSESKTVPNQGKEIYDRVSGTTSAVSEQKSLVNANEEPVDLNITKAVSDNPDNNQVTAPSVAGKVTPSDASEEPILVPVKVQTTIVRSDGTIVPQTQTLAISPTSTTDMTAPKARPTQKGEEQQPIIPRRLVKTRTITPEITLVKPQNIPVVRSRVEPADTSMHKTPETQITSKVNMSENYLIQIASQPTEEAARQSYANLLRRYADVLSGRGFNIRRADILGKGTYYRVRVSAGSKDEAIALCARYKMAGGTCLITQ